MPLKANVPVATYKIRVDISTRCSCLGETQSANSCRHSEANRCSDRSPAHPTMYAAVAADHPITAITFAHATERCDGWMQCPKPQWLPIAIWTAFTINRSTATRR